MEDASKSRWIEAALKQHEAKLIRYATHILADIERAREIVQETFLRLCKEKPESVDGHLPQWLFTVCRNLAFDVRKKENRMTPLTEGIGADVPPARDAFDHRENMSMVLRVLETLPKNQREVVHLKFHCDFSYREISDVTGLTVSNVGFLIHTAIKSIRTQLLPSPETVRRTQ